MAMSDGVSDGVWKKTPEHIGKILEKVWKKIEKKREEKIEFSKISENLNLVLGKEIGAHIKPYKIYRKKLIVLVNAPVYLQELLFQKEGIIEAVNRSIGKELIKNVTFRVGE
jgi:sulfatase maturation enzyme AslB (radical SAM superfamily)